MGWRRCSPDIPSSPVFLWFMVLCDLDLCWTRALDYNQLLDIKGFLWKGSQAGQVPNSFLSSGEMVALWLSPKSLSYNWQSFLPCSLVTRPNWTCSSMARAQTVSGKIFPRKSEWTQDAPGADFPSHGLPTLSCTVLAKDLVLEIPFRNNTRVRKILRGQMCSQKIKAETSAKMDVEQVLSQQKKKKNPNPRHTKLVLSFFHAQWSQSAGAPCLHLEREERWMVAHNQNRIAVFVSMFPPTSASKVKGWEKRKGPWLQIWLRCILYCFLYECCYWWSALGF